MKIDQKLVSQFVAPVIAVLVVVNIYTTQIPGMQAASDIAYGYRAQDEKTRLEAFKRAASRDSFAQQKLQNKL